MTMASAISKEKVRFIRMNLLFLSIIAAKRGADYSFTPPALTPLAKYFWING